MNTDSPVCQACQAFSACKSPFMGSLEKTQPLDILFVYDSPSFLEDRSGIGEFTLIPDMMSSVDMRWACTYAVRCRSQKQKVPAKQLRHCRSHVLADIAAMKPKMVVALGSVATEALTGNKKVTEVRGRVTEQDGFKCVPTLSPASIAHNPSNIDKIIRDIDLAVSTVKGEAPSKKLGDYRVVRTSDDLTQMIEEAEVAELIAWDIETNTLDPFSNDPKPMVVCVQFSFAAESGWLVPLFHTEKVPVDFESRLDAVKLLLQEPFFPPLIGQNLKFDSGFMRAVLGINPRKPVFDTFLAHHLIDEESSQTGGNGLKQMAWTYTSMGGYEEELEQKYPNFYSVMHTVPLDELAVYACGDVDCVMRLHPILRRKLEAEKMVECLGVELDIQEMLMNLELQGAAINWDYQKHLEEMFPKQMDRLISAIRMNADVMTVEEQLGKPFNPRSVDHVKKLVFDVLQLPCNDNYKTQTGEYSVGKEVIQEWLETSKNPAARAILKQLMQYKKTATLHSNYVANFDKFRGSDDRVHTRFNQARVVTGRLSSQNPNLQKLPRDDESLDEGWYGKGHIKQMFIGAKPGWWVAEADFSQIELRLAAIFSQDPIMIEAFQNGQDLHAKTAASALGMPYEEFMSLMETGDQKAKSARTGAKAINFGIIYGMGEFSLAKKLRNARLAERLFQAHRDTYPVFWSWRNKKEAEIRKLCYARNVLGYRRHLPNARANDNGVRSESLRMGINSLIQGPAVKMTLIAEVNIDRLLREDGYESRCFGQVHDSILLTGPQGELDDVLSMTLIAMENLNLPFLVGEDPNFPLVVPIVAEAKVGSTLKNVKEWIPAHV